MKTRREKKANSNLLSSEPMLQIFDESFHEQHEMLCSANRAGNCLVENLCRQHGVRESLIVCSLSFGSENSTRENLKIAERRKVRKNSIAVKNARYSEYLLLKLELWHFLLR